MPLFVPQDRDAHELLDDDAALGDHDGPMLAEEIEQVGGGVLAVRVIGRDGQAVEERRGMLAGEIGEDGVDDPPDVG